ncbi:MAG: alpha-(1-_3)-arabinofuranosyltransferase domain-containing protein, partial [Acidimicrobiales bacterium]
MSDTSSEPPTSAAPPRRGIVKRVRGLDPIVSVATVLLAAASYVPSFLTRPGIVADDAKQYLYLDPGKLISSAISMWNPDVGMGTVTHQNIGFLFPMGPYYWIVQQLHIPMWVGQRFWMGSLFFFAGTGVFFLGRLLGLNRWGRIAAGVAYTFTPFVIDYIARISPIVMPWTALGWMVGLVILSVRKGGWRYPAWFAIVIALVGGVNATSILLAGLAPALWLVYAVWITKEAPLRRALAAVLRLGVLSLGVSLWWAAGLWAEGVYGLNILKFTETIPTVTSTSLSSEVVRGLGYWYFYGQDKIQPWTSAALGYMQSGWLIGVSFAVPAVGALVGALTRWRYRAFAVGLLLIGVVAAVAAYPLGHPSPLGQALRAAGSDSTIGLAMRSTNRVIPLIVLGFALLLGAGISALAAARFKTSLVVLAVAVAASVADLPPLWNGTLVATNLARPEQLPGYVLATAKYLNAHGTGRVLGLPGEDFAYYRWGVAGDPVWPGLIDRPYVARQVVPQGEPASADLLQALDESIQDGVFNPATLVPLARLMSATNLLFQGNEQYERFNTARPQPLWLDLLNPSTGLGPPVSFGTPRIDKTTTFPLQDETQLAVPTGASVPPPAAVFTVKGSRPLVRTETTAAPLVVAGSGTGLVNASAAGLLDGDPTIFYAASFAKNKKGLDQLLNNGAVLVLTDTNPKQQETWGSLDDNAGYVQQAKFGPLAVDPNEQSLAPVAAGGTAAQTVSTLSGVSSVRASVYGNPITNTPEDQAYNAFDQNPDTRWAEGAFGPGTGAQLQVTLDHPVTASEIRLLQPQTGPRDRWITRVSLSFDGHRTVTRHLGPVSRKEPGQVVHFPTATFKTLTLTVKATSSGVRKTYNGFSGVGFADVTIAGVAPVVQTLRLPTDLLSSVGTTSITHPLVILLSRLRAASVPPRSDPEQNLNRSFSLPTARTFSIGGGARIAATDPDPVIDQLVGRTPVKVTAPGPGKTSGAEVVFANSSGRLPGDLSAGADAAIDGNAGTAWMPGFGPQDGNWVQYSFNRPVSFAYLVMKVVTDGRHSIPTEITVSTGPESRTIKLPPVPDGKGRPQGSTTTVPLLFPTLTGQQVRITIDKTRALKELDYYSNAKQTFPVGLAEIGLPGIDGPSTPPTTSSGCLTN